MQRIMIGIAGLSFVVLLVLIASVGMRPVRSVAPANAQGETLATLGVAPGAEDVMLRRSTQSFEAAQPEDKRISGRI